VPVFFIRLDIDDVAWSDLLHLGTSASDVADAVGGLEGLAPRVSVPRRPSAWCEPHVGTTDARLLVGIADAVDEQHPDRTVAQSIYIIGGAGVPTPGAEWRPATELLPNFIESQLPPRPGVNMVIGGKVFRLDDAGQPYRVHDD
jgi:hypothetical protein